MIDLYKNLCNISYIIFQVNKHNGIVDVSQNFDIDPSKMSSNNLESIHTVMKSTIDDINSKLTQVIKNHFKIELKVLNDTRAKINNDDKNNDYNGIHGEIEVKNN